MKEFQVIGFIAGTFVMKIEAKDDDEEGSPNTEISYRIVNQEPMGTGHMFRINARTGELFVKEPTLDREVRPWPQCVNQLYTYSIP